MLQFARVLKTPRWYSTGNYKSRMFLEVMIDFYHRFHDKVPKMVTLTKHSNHLEFTQIAHVPICKPPVP